MDRDERETFNEGWQKRWADGNIGWHRMIVNPYLMQHFEELKKGSAENRILVPMSGKTKDLKWLADQGVQVRGVEISHQATEEFFKELSIEPEVQAINMAPSGVHIFSHGESIKIFACDFLDFKSKIAGGDFDMVWDRGSFCIWQPQHRQPYIDHLHSLLKPGGKILIECYEYEQEVKTSPPHPITHEELEKCMGDKYTIEQLDRYTSEEYHPEMASARMKDCYYAHYMLTKK